MAGIVVYFADTRASAARLRRDWEACAPEGELVIIEAGQDRSPAKLLSYLDALQAEPHAAPLTVVAPDTHVAAMLQDRPGVVVGCLPWEAPA